MLIRIFAKKKIAHSFGEGCEVELRVIPRAFEVNETHRIGQSATNYDEFNASTKKTARKNLHQNATTLFPHPAERALELSVNNIFGRRASQSQ